MRNPWAWIIGAFSGGVTLGYIIGALSFLGLLVTIGIAIATHH